MIRTSAEAMGALARAWPQIVDECRAVLGGEQHYQAVIYHCLRDSGQIPRDQLGMNVKQWITDPVTPLFQAWDVRKHINFRGGFEPIPDAVIFSPDVRADWRRRNAVETLRCMLVAVEIKASERAGKRLGGAEVVRDIEKLAAQRDEIIHRGGTIRPVMLVVDTAPDVSERMSAESLTASISAAQQAGVEWMYVSRDQVTSTLGEAKLG